MILGAGPAGAVAACRLAGHRRVLVVDRYVMGERPQRIGESLPAAGKRILHDLGLWEEFQSQGHHPAYHYESRWGSDELQISQSIQNLDGNGYLLDRARFEEGLLKVAMDRGAEMMKHSGLRSVKRVEGRWLLSFSGRAGEEEIIADWVIDASGASSVFAKKIGMQREYVDRLVCLWAIGSSEIIMPQSGCYVQSAEDGWWYTSPLPGGRRMLAFFSDSSLLKGGADDAAWLLKKAKNELHLSDLLEYEHWKPLTKLRKNAAHSSRLEQCQGDGWCAIGDAAQSFDPLSSQGMFHAMYSGKVAAECLLANDLSYHQMGEDQIWQHYLTHLSHFYQSEQRWIGSPFWKARGARCAENKKAGVVI